MCAASCFMHVTSQNRCMGQGVHMSLTREDSIHRQRDALAQILRDPIEQVTSDCIPLWDQRKNLENILLVNFSRIPYCAGLYALASNGRQTTDIVSRSGILPGYIGRDRSQRPYMKKLVPAYGFLLSDAYISQYQQRPLLTAVQVVRCNDKMLGYICADFDLRDLPLTSECFQENVHFADMTAVSAIAAPPADSSRIESPMDKNLDKNLQILEELMTHHGVFQCHLHFASSQVTIWHGADPFQYRILGQEELALADILPDYPHENYPSKANIPQRLIKPILVRLRNLRLTNETIYLRHASINIFNGMINLSFSCDGSQYLKYQEFLQKNNQDWLFAAETSTSPILF